MAEGFLYDRGDELIERKDLSESLVPEIDPDTDEGKVLAVDSEGKAGWEAPGKESVFHECELSLSTTGGNIETKDLASPTLNITLSESGVKLSKLKEELDAGKDVFLVTRFSGGGYTYIPQQIFKCKFDNNAVCTSVPIFVFQGTAYTFYTNSLILHGVTSGNTLTSGIITSIMYHYVANET